MADFAFAAHVAAKRTSPATRRTARPAPRRRASLRCDMASSHCGFISNRSDIVSQHASLNPRGPFSLQNSDENHAACCRRMQVRPATGRHRAVTVVPSIRNRPRYCTINLGEESRAATEASAEYSTSPDDISRRPRGGVLFGIAAITDIIAVANDNPHHRVEAATWRDIEDSG